MYREAWKIQDFNGVWTRDLAMLDRCHSLTNWAMKPLMLGVGHLWFQMFLWWMNLWMKWIIYWIPDMKSSEAIILAVMNAILAIAYREDWKIQDHSFTWFHIRSSIDHSFHISDGIGEACDYFVSGLHARLGSWRHTRIASWAFEKANNPIKE